MSLGEKVRSEDPAGSVLLEKPVDVSSGGVESMKGKKINSNQSVIWEGGGDQDKRFLYLNAK